MRSISRIMLSVLLAGVAVAQTKPGSAPVAPPFTSVPQIEDRNLYYAFFNYHQTLVSELQAAINANPSNGAQLNQQMAPLLNVNVSELAVVINNTQQVTKAYAALATERQAPPVAVAGKVQPTTAQLNAEFDFKQVRITVEGVRYLSQNLSSASWNGLHSYITGTYKNTIYKH